MAESRCLEAEGRHGILWRGLNPFTTLFFFIIGHGAFYSGYLTYLLSTIPQSGHRPSSQGPRKRRTNDNNPKLFEDFECDKNKKCVVLIDLWNKYLSGKDLFFMVLPWDLFLQSKEIKTNRTSQHGVIDRCKNIYIYVYTKRPN